MGRCPVHSPGEGSDRDDANSSGGNSVEQNGKHVRRREFVKSALLIGGASAVGSLESAAGITTNVRAQETEPIDAGMRLNRQHAWDAFEPVVGSGNTKPPENSLCLLLEYRGEGEPDPDHRRQVEVTLDEIERHFEWNHEGVLFTMAYSASYFDRFEEDPPAGAAPDDAETVAETVEELTDLAGTNDDVEPDTADAMLLLASDNEANLLTAEAALWGESDDVTFEETFEGVFGKPGSWPDRRVGSLGGAFQEKRDEYENEVLAGFEEEQIPEESPLSMGFVAGFGASMPEEDNVTLRQGQRFPGPDIDAADVPTDLAYVGEVGERDPGVFAGGTLKHFAHLEIDLSGWYGDNDADTRRHQMYSPYHTEGETNARGGDQPGSGLTEDDPDDPNAVGPDADRETPRKTTLEYADETEATAAGEDGEVLAVDQEGDPIPTAGHSQKAARARYDADGDGELEQPVLRRDWDLITPLENGDGETGGYLFNVPMRFEESIYSLLDANYNVGFTSLDGGFDHDPVDNDDIEDRNGIAPHMTATRRGNWLVPPITLRALPHPRGAAAAVDIDTDGEVYTVELEGVGRTDGDGGVDPETVQFGSAGAVNRARGVAPSGVERRNGTVTFEFDAAETELEAGDTAKLFLKTEDTRKPLTGTGEIPDAGTEESDDETGGSDDAGAGASEGEQAIGGGGGPDEEGSGFGLPAGLAGLGTAAYYLKRRFGGDEE